MILADPDGAADAIQKAFTGIVAKLSAISSRRTRERGDGNAAAASIYSTVRLTRVVNQTAFGGPLAARGVTDLDFMLSRARPDDAALARLARRSPRSTAKTR